MKYQTKKINHPDTRATKGSTDGPKIFETAINKPERAPVGPTILNSDPPKTAARNPPQKAATIPATGLDPLAMAKEIERGMFTKETVNPDLQFVWKSSYIIW